MPPSWLAELGDDERSMRRTLIGEWRFMQNAMRSLQAGSEETPISDGDADFWDRMEWRLFSPLYQPQDFSNRYAELLAQLIELFRTPYSDLPAAYEKAADIHDGTPQPFRRAYNIIGDWLFSIAAPDFANYAARVSDLEGIRRAAVVTATLRARGLAPEDVPGSLAAAELANPYTDEPFAWLDDSKEVFFEGLYAGDRGRHRFPY